MNFQSVHYKSTVRCYATTCHKPMERFCPKGKQRRVLRNTHGNLAEFGPALVLFFVLILFPAWALIRFGATSAAISLIVTRAADTAAKAPSYGLALSGANRILEQMVDSPVGCVTCLKHERLKCLNLYVRERITATGETNVFGPDEPFGKPINAAVNTYEYEVRAYYSFEPLLPNTSLPGLQNIPLLTEQLSVTFRAVRAVEYPGGLSTL